MESGGGSSSVGGGGGGGGAAAPGAGAAGADMRAARSPVWRDSAALPPLVEVRHVNSIQHHLLMSAPPPAFHPQQAALYQQQQQQHQQQQQQQQRYHEELLLREQRDKQMERAKHQERERERERLEQLEKQRVATDQAVQKHFEESLRLAHQKRSMCWNINLINSLPPPQRGAEDTEGRKQQPEQQQQQRFPRQPERTFYQAQQRAPTAPKVEYPPPPAHSRALKPEKPKAEANFNLYGYPAPYLVHESVKVKAEPPKSSVIVKNEVKHTAPPSPKPQYRSPSQSPHHHLAAHRHTPSPHPTVEPQNLAGGGKVRPRVSPPAPAADPRFAAYKAVGVAPGYPYPALATTAAAHYALAKPKVSSPAPQHIYGKPVCVVPPPGRVAAPSQDGCPLPLTSKAQPLPSVSPSPYQQVMHLQAHPPPQPQVPPGAGQPPPPAHSSRAGSVPPGALYYKGASPPDVRSPVPVSAPVTVSLLPPSLHGAFQTQPLDLGVGGRDELSGSPKRRDAPSPGADPKRRRCDPPLARVSEPSPLIASAATTITTVVNTAAYVSVPVPSDATPSPAGSPAPSTPAKPPPSSADSDKSNSPGPVRSTTSYPVHKLKKAWLQRHSGEDVANAADPPIAAVATPAGAIPKPAQPCRKGKEPVLNGHAPDKADDSSSSEAEAKQPPKRKPPKLKRKKGAFKKQAIAIPMEDQKRKKTSNSAESGSSSEKESASEDKDTDSGASSHQGGRKSATATGGGGGTGNNGKEPRKRGRRPKPPPVRSGNNNDRSDEPRGKKQRDDPPAPQRNPFRKPPVAQLKKTGESFLQDGPCHEVAPKLAKCRECRWTPNQRSRNMPNIFCRFYAFRRLRYTKNGQLAIAGFSDPHKDPGEEDMKLWLPVPDNPPVDLDLIMAKFLLAEVGDQFCDLVKQEKEAMESHMSEEKTIAWKRVVKGVREMCDVCETTLFNFHWACGKCGFAVCIDCYKGRKVGKIRLWAELGKDRDDFSWLLCTNRQGHEQEKLMLTQIIAGDSLVRLGEQLHFEREQWGIPQFCGCIKSESTNGVGKDLAKTVKMEPLNGFPRQEKRDDISDNDPNVASNGSVAKQEDTDSPLNWLAEVALYKGDRDFDDTNSSESDDKGDNFSTLRELLIRPSHKSNGSRAASPSEPVSPNSKKSRTKVETVAAKVNEEIGSEGELKHYVRRFKWCKWQEKKYEALPPRTMSKLDSTEMYPGVPHTWLCDGRLLRLTEPMHRDNYDIFQDQWKRGQPVIVSEVSKHLDMSLWHPDSFARDFGDDKNDLVNCMTGNVVPNQPMRKFWEGFEHFSRRLKDEDGKPMLLKLKDWPPGDDFAEMLPSRFSDLMRVLPLSEYTHRTGRLNLASRLPECFVRPDLGPKMYNAYGSALYPSNGTTNLHLDISDAVNVMVYVGIPKDGDSEEHIKEAFRAIDEAGCDILMRRRVREKGELPGALWHIYNARDADKIRDLLNKVALENGSRLEPHHDPIHDQSWYLDGNLRNRLFMEYGVEGYAIVQCLGDSVFIPAGAPHQVRNLHNCIKVAEDFVSPENISHCFHLTQEFRDLSDTHSNHEDKLQIKNIVYHTVKDSISVLIHARNKNTANGSGCSRASPDRASVKVEAAGSPGESNGDLGEVEIKKEPDT